MSLKSGTVKMRTLFFMLSLFVLRTAAEPLLFSCFEPTPIWSVCEGIAARSGQPVFCLAAQQEPTLFKGLSKNKAPYLFTTESFGDVAVDLEFMIPEDSNAGLFFMGRYEVQIFDSFGRIQLDCTDLGAIYQRWRGAVEAKKLGKPRGYAGIPPRINASKPAGEWQTLSVIFHAPHFDQAGHKLKDAQFVSVRVNGVQVQQEVSINGPTRGAPRKGEVARAPLAIQGDHGPVAIRRFRIRAL